MANDSIYRELRRCRIIDLNAAELGPADLAELCNRIAWDEGASVVLIIFGNESGQRLAGTPNSAVDLISKLKQPVIGAIQGDATGFSLEMALACDIRIGTERARFGLAQVKDGLIPSNGGTQRLPRLIGQAKALEMILTGEAMGAAEACRIGLLHRAVAPELLISTATEMAESMASKSPLSLIYAKEALYSGGDLTLDQGIRLELDLYLHLFTTQDRAEGITAFRDRKKPQFRGE